MTQLLSDEEIRARIAQIEQRPDMRLVKPLSAVADSLVDALQVEDGIQLGLGTIDVLTRGFRPQDLIVITGFAHSGKTQAVNTMLCENPQKRVLFFSLDDPAEMILAKLVAMKSGMSSERIEARVRAGDAETIRMIGEVAAKDFPNLFVVDEVIGIPAMLQAVAEATALWGEGPHAVIIDYVEMMPGEGHNEDQAASVKQKINSLKRWAKASPYPVIALHQGTRTNAKPGEPITLLSMGFSGEQQATIVIGVRRKKDDASLEQYERDMHENTITMHVVKNKRPGGRCTSYDGVDYRMDPLTGVIGEQRDVASTTPHDVLAERRKALGEDDAAIERMQDQLAAEMP